MDPKIIAALVTSATSLFVAIWVYITNRKSQHDLELLKADLSRVNAEQDARRDYEYDARKRLYEECEPLLFQMSELAENAQHRIFSLARTTLQGNLPYWLNQEGYYLRSTIYHLLSPHTVFRMIQRRLTTIDLKVEPIIRSQYKLMKLCYLLFTEDFTLANCEPKLKYDPNIKDWRKKREENQRVYWRQGLPIGRLDNSIECLIKNNNSSFCISFGEFEKEILKDESLIKPQIKMAYDLFIGFHPNNRPILWRILITQAIVYSYLIKIHQSRSLNVDFSLNALSDMREACYWKKQSDKETEKQKDEFEIAYDYLKNRVPFFTCSGSK